jgi:methylenetetrahydrofolate--tRNA-(uracil-5-)-methyltransferase
MAKRGKDALRYGPMRPVGITSLEGNRFYAVLQLRRENTAAGAFNMVGFQTNLRFPEQKRVFSLIPALKNAEFLRYGVMHRNTYVNSPKLLDNTFMLKAHPNVYIAGQLSGVEGYMESALSGLIAGLSMSKRLCGIKAEIPNEYTMTGALIRYVTNQSITKLQPMTSNFGLLPPLNTRDKNVRKQEYAARAKDNMNLFICGITK